MYFSFAIAFFLLMIMNIIVDWSNHRNWKSKGIIEAITFFLLMYCIAGGFTWCFVDRYIIHNGF